MELNALTYNMSWATQENVVEGTEKEFVAACQKKYKKGGIQCNENAIKNIKNIPQLDLMFLQEVNSKIEEKIMKVQPKLKKFMRAKKGLEIISTIWNPNVFGKVVYKDYFNLLKSNSNFRPCLILVFERPNKDLILVINSHFPHKKNIKLALKKIKKKIFSSTYLKSIITNDSLKIIFGGDFNDEYTQIHSNRPLTFKNIKLKHIKNKKKSRKTLKTCCWRANSKKYFSDTGDYILVNKNVKQLEIEIPKIFKKNGRKNRLFSDHMPVFSRLII